MGLLKDPLLGLAGAMIMKQGFETWHFWSDSKACRQTALEDQGEAHYTALLPNISIN